MPYSKKAKYRHYRQRSPKDFDPKSFQTVKFNHVRYQGKKFKGYHKSGTRAKAVIGKEKKTGKSKIQSILIPK